MADKWCRLAAVVVTMCFMALLCGGEKVPVRRKRIIGGKPVDFSDMPPVVSLGSRKKHVCHGFLATGQFVITTAHCITKYKWLKVTTGRINLDMAGKRRKIADFKVHPNWDKDDPSKWSYDEAVVKLDKPVTRHSARPRVPKENTRMCFPGNGSSVFPTGFIATVVGWGMTGTTESLPAPRTLQAVNVKVSDHGQCKEKYQGVTEDMVCAGNDEGGHDICLGDSGAPLVVKEDGDFLLLGSNIRGPSTCGEPNMPAVYLIHDYTFIKDAIIQMGPKPTPKQCGKRNDFPSFRVQNGQETAPYSLPWMAYITDPDGAFEAGAVSINESYVATYDASVGDYVVFGAHDRSSPSEPVQRIMIEEVFTHPDSANMPYKGMTLAKLSFPVCYNRHIGPICLPQADEVLTVGSRCLISGWGRNLPEWTTDRLHEGVVKTISNQQCKDASPPHWHKYLTKYTICTAYDETRPSTWGDEGGPLVCQKNNSGSWFLHGVVFLVSLVEKRPAMYWSVPEMVPWINEVMGLPAPTADASDQICFKKYEG